MVLRIPLLSLFLTACIGGFSQHLAHLKTATVLNGNGERYSINLPDNKLVVLITLGADCPITQKYVPIIQSLKDSFATETIFIGIFPKQTSVAEMNSFIREYGISMPCFVDHESQVTGLLNAAVTPEAFLVDSKHTQLYAGAIDNWFYKLGSYRSKTTQHYLRDAIQSYLDGRAIEVTRTEAIGCPIAKSVKPHHGH